MRKVFILTSIVIGGILSSTPTTTYGTMPTGGSTAGGAPEVPVPYNAQTPMICDITENNGLPSTGIGYVYFTVSDSDKWKYESTGTIVDLGTDPSLIGQSVTVSNLPAGVTRSNVDVVATGQGWITVRVKFVTFGATSGASFSMEVHGIDSAVDYRVDDDDLIGAVGCTVHVN